MFYCNECANNNEWPRTIIKSKGDCEVCGIYSVCNECKSSQLPEPKNKNEQEPR